MLTFKEISSFVQTKVDEADAEILFGLGRSLTAQTLDEVFED